jgi:excisionase family DNA binding protein
VIGGMAEQLLTARELGQLLSFSAATIVDWSEAGKLPAFKIGGRLRFRLSEVEAWLEQRRLKGPGVGGEVAPVPYQSPDPRHSLPGAPVPLRGGEHA